AAHADDAFRCQDPVHLAQRPLRIGKVLDERMAEYPLEPAALEGERIDISRFKSDVTASVSRRRLRRPRDLSGRKIDPDDCARVDEGCDAYGDRAGAASAIEKRHAWPQMRHKERPVGSE